MPCPCPPVLSGAFIPSSGRRPAPRTLVQSRCFLCEPSLLPHSLGTWLSHRSHQNVRAGCVVLFPLDYESFFFLIFINRTLFSEQFDMHSRIKRKVKGFSQTLYPHMCTASPCIHIRTSGVFVPVNEPILIPHHHLSPLYVRVHAWQWAFLELEQVCNDVCLSLKAHTVYLHRPQHPLCSTGTCLKVGAGLVCLFTLALFCPGMLCVLSRRSYSWAHVRCKSARSAHMRGCRGLCPLGLLHSLGPLCLGVPPVRAEPGIYFNVMDANNWLHFHPY